MVGSAAPQNHLWTLCVAMKVLKEKREVITVNHWDEGSESLPCSACRFNDFLQSSRCCLVHTVWLHSLFKRWLNGKVGRRSGHLLFTYSSFPHLSVKTCHRQATSNILSGSKSLHLSSCPNESPGWAGSLCLWTVYFILVSPMSSTMPGIAIN